MAEALIGILPQLGVGAVSLIVLYLLITKFMEETTENRKAFITFVSEHNHKTAELISESTSSIKENTEQNKIVSEHLRTTTELMKDVRDHFIKEH